MGYIGELWPQSGLVGLWHLNGNSTDFSGNNFNGTDTNMTYSLAAGKFNQGGIFNGSNGKITTSTSTSLNVGSAFTLSHWVYPIAYPSTAYNTINKLTFATSGWMLYADASKIWTFFCYGLTPNNVADTVTFSTGAWQHIVCVYTGSALQIYINGVLKNSANVTGSPSVSANAMEMGNYNGTYFNGYLDEVAIFNVAKDAAWVRKQYAWSVGKFL